MPRFRLPVPRAQLDPEVQQHLEHRLRLQVQAHHHFLLVRRDQLDPEVQRHLEHRQHPRGQSDLVDLEVQAAPLVQAGPHCPWAPVVR